MTFNMQKARHNNLLNAIRVTPLAAESFGVRSMCTLVETPDLAVLLEKEDEPMLGEVLRRHSFGLLSIGLEQARDIRKRGKQSCCRWSS